MLDPRELKENFDEIKALLSRRGEDYNLEKFIELDKTRRELLQVSENIKAKQNAANKQIPQLKKEGKDIASLMEEMKALSDEIKEMEPKVRAVEEEMETFLLNVPNAPHPDTPLGVSDAENVEVRRWNSPAEFGFDPKPHWELGEALGILDVVTATKMTGSRFTLLKGLGARLERALINFMLERHVCNGYEEVSTPYMVHRRSMVGTGQLPKFEEDAFGLVDTEYFMIPTAEVSVTNIHREEILDGAALPIYYCAYSPSFRKEAGSAGRDTRGLIRQHQFHKVELVKFTCPEDSYAELEKLTLDAEDILQKLNLPYRVVRLCTGDLTFCSAMTYDIEVWMPSYERYVEISSCSNFEGYQARRAKIRFKEGANGKPQFVHTLNGSGIPIGRTIAAILENFQQADGSIKIPEVLVPYMQGVRALNKQEALCREGGGSNG